VALSAAPSGDHVDTEVISPSPYHCSAICLYNHINPVVISSLDLHLDLVVPPYLSLPTVIDIIKFICDDDCSFQAASKELLLECLELMEDDGESSKAIVPLVAPIELPKKRRAKKSIDHVDVKSLRHCTCLNKDLGGFKALGLAGADQDEVPHYVGSFDRDAAHGPPPPLSEGNLQAYDGL
jgi:hypothetical protein